MLMFALASFPGTALRSSKFYMLLGLLLTGPLAKWIAPALLFHYHRLKDAK